MEDPNPEVKKAVLFERRILMTVTVGQLVALMLWIVAISTNGWTEVRGVEDREVFVPKTQRYLLYATTGVWRSCRYAYANKSKPVFYDQCTNIQLFPPEGSRTETTGLLDQQRSVAAFAIISTCIQVLGLVFSFYTFKLTRYMFKRLAACCHLIASGCTLTVIEVTTNAVELEARNFPTRHPKGTEWHYGYSYIIAWFTFVLLMVATIAFAACSRKRKKNKAPDEQFALEEEPIIIGR
ncbi:PMP-22/EMP/MP20/Claudin superfamily [Trinorchestia longiramus]|nr:PMP-22/EMP/MP20/Claudin superfamily [Trinorchestia longiramus]